MFVLKVRVVRAPGTSFGNKIRIFTDNIYIYTKLSKFNLYPFIEYSTFTVSSYYNWNSAMEIENGLINGPNHAIPSMNRIKKMQPLIEYQYTVYTILKSILFNSAMLDQYEIKLI